MGRARSTVVNRLIGIRIRKRRIMLGLSQRDLGKLVGMTNKQTHKYETGINGVSAGLLYAIAHELITPLEYFFQELEQGERQRPSRRRTLLNVMRNFDEVQNEKYLEAANQLTRALAGR
jgi:transcriptional regulator with XRE-family HTH domain